MGCSTHEVTGGGGRWREERRSRPTSLSFTGSDVGPDGKIPAKDPKKASSECSRRAGQDPAGTGERPSQVRASGRRRRAGDVPAPAPQVPVHRPGLTRQPVSSGRPGQPEKGGTDPSDDRCRRGQGSARRDAGPGRSQRSPPESIQVRGPHKEGRKAHCGEERKAWKRLPPPPVLFFPLFSSLII